MHQPALSGLARQDRRAAIPALQRGHAIVQPEAALLHPRAMAALAVPFEQRLNVARKIDFCGRGRRQLRRVCREGSEQ